mgnify:CR=1 FL=1
MDKKKLTIFAVAGVVLLTVCSVFLTNWLSKETVSGKVMVVQRNAEVRKLALVRIYAVSEAEARAWHDSVTRECRSILDASANRRASGVEERKRIMDENDSMIRRCESLLNIAVEMRELSRELLAVFGEEVGCHDVRRSAWPQAG